MIGFLGRFVEAKGIHLIREALEALRTPYRALFVGDGPLAGELLAWQHREPERVRVVRGVKHGEVSAFVNAMSVLVAPSRTTPNWREQFGRMLIEGMACGVPVVQPNCAAFTDLVESTGAGRLFEPANTQSLVDEWEKLLANPAEARALGLKGRAAVEGDFSLSRMAERFVETTRESIDVLAAKS